MLQLLKVSKRNESAVKGMITVVLGIEKIVNLLRKYAHNTNE